jgi:hypothetical protein
MPARSDKQGAIRSKNLFKKMEKKALTFIPTPDKQATEEP